MKISNIQQTQYSFKHLHKHKHSREAFFEKIGIYPPYSKIFANFDVQQLSRTMQLLRKGVSPDCIKELTTLDKRKYKQAIQLANDGLFDNYLYQIANLDEPFFAKAMKYRKNGLTNDCLAIYSKLSEKEIDIARQLIKNNHLSPFEAVNLAQLSEEQRKKALDLLELAEVQTVCEIAVLDEEKQKKCKTYLEQGIDSNYVIEISDLNEEEEKRLPEIFNLKVGDINITDFAKMSEFEYKRAKELLALGVNPNAIYDIILIETGQGKNEDYSTYRNRGYSYSTSASLSALNDVQIETLEKLIKIHPEMSELFKDEYSVSVIQLQTDDEQEAILTQNIRTDNGTTITLVQTFDTYGDKTQSRLETYSDNSTSSIMRNKTGVFKAKYDKYGQIRELTELLQDINTKEVTGVIHTKASPILTGALESTYYDINDIKEGGNITPDIDFEKCVSTTGEKLSSVVQNKDGSITYSEDYQLNDYGITRNYTEKKDNEGKISYSSYSYQITHIDENDNETTVMDISREFIKNKDGSTTNTINGITYEITYDENEKTVTITDGRNRRILDFARLLPIFSEDILWNAIKQLQVDSLLTINDNIKKWKFCKEDYSLTDEHNKVLATGENTGIITHEVGHIKIKENTSILKNEELIQLYGQEMYTFKMNMPYNEQEFIQYFSQRAELTDSDGLEEFIAEANVLLTTYGMNYKDLNTRTQFLAKYFPKTITKVAELLGKTSTKSLLE